jgi:hypothetical protein
LAHHSFNDVLPLSLFGFVSPDCVLGYCAGQVQKVIFHGFAYASILNCSSRHGSRVKSMKRMKRMKRMRKLWRLTTVAVK